MSYSLRSPIRTNKGRQATETEGLVVLETELNSIFTFVFPTREETSLPERGLQC